MKRILFVLLLIAITAPASAGVLDAMFGSPRTTVSVLNAQPQQQQQQSCNPPQNLVGKSIMQIEGMRFNQPVRILHPGEMITSDYNSIRLNIGLDQNGIIREVHCG